MESFKSERKEFGSFSTKTNGDTESISQKRLCKQNKQKKPMHIKEPQIGNFSIPLLRLTEKVHENNFYSFLRVVFPEAQILDKNWAIIIQ